MRGNTNPCSLCEYCDDSCDVCLHQPYENTDSAYYCDPSSCDESGFSDGSTDVDSDSDEDGSWFTTPWSKLITERIAGYEIDPEIGVQLTPIEDQPREEEEERENEKEKEGGGGGGEMRSRRRQRRKRRGRRKGSAEQVVDSAVESASNEERTEPAAEGEATPANDVEQVEYIETITELANTEVLHEPESVPKDGHDNTWSESVQASVSQIIPVDMNESLTDDFNSYNVQSNKRRDVKLFLDMFKSCRSNALKLLQRVQFRRILYYFHFFFIIYNFNSPNFQVT